MRSPPRSIRKPLRHTASEAPSAATVHRDWVENRLELRRLEVDGRRFWWPRAAVPLSALLVAGSVADTGEPAGAKAAVAAQSLELPLLALRQTLETAAAADWRLGVDAQPETVPQLVRRRAAPRRASARAAQVEPYSPLRLLVGAVTRVRHPRFR